MVRVRFAPSPTGLPHVGNIRTALFNWLFARHHGGKFVLRIEDTDRQRYDPRALDAIFEGLLWLGLEWDEGPRVGGEYGPYFQSQRLEIYHEHARRLVAEGKAYYCTCPPERLEALRKEQLAKKLPVMYDRHCRDKNIKGDPTDPDKVVRLKMPTEGETVFYDVLRGEVRFENRLLDDIVLIKSDGYPTYHFANVVDDHLMGITHVMRAEEWISSTGKHIRLYEAFGWDPPKFVHLPMILGPDKSKLSKRHGATAITEFMEKGFLPEAMFNYLALLGWSAKDDTEIMTREELISRFDIDGLSPKAAVFDIEKLKWMNGEYIRMLSPEDLTEKLLPFYRRWGWDEKFDRGHLDRISFAMRERLKTLEEMREKGFYFFEEPEGYEPKGVRKHFKPHVADWLEEVSRRFEALDAWSEGKLEQIVRGYADELGVGVGKVIHPIRLAVSGTTAGPSLFLMLDILGRETVLRRLRRAVEWIRNNVSK